MRRSLLRRQYLTTREFQVYKTKLSTAGNEECSPFRSLRLRNKVLIYIKLSQIYFINIFYFN
jgi:hypothetical protein